MSEEKRKDIAGASKVVVSFADKKKKSEKARDTKDYEAMLLDMLRMEFEQ